MEAVRFIVLHRKNRCNPSPYLMRMGGQRLKKGWLENIRKLMGLVGISLLHVFGKNTPEQILLRFDAADSLLLEFLV